MTTQNQRVISYMRDFGSINPLQALSDLGVMRLASRISDIKRMGYGIEKKMAEGRNRYGETVRYAEYRLMSIREVKGDES
mgnify:CR=1 FL=1|jgi:hypothetical protein